METLASQTSYLSSRLPDGQTVEMKYLEFGHETTSALDFIRIVIIKKGFSEDYLHPIWIHCFFGQSNADQLDNTESLNIVLR